MAPSKSARKLIAKSKQFCVFCGAKKNLTLHHLDPSDKTAEVYRLKGVSNIQNEIDKCICLCNDCHNTYMHPSHQKFYDTHNIFKGLKAQKITNPVNRLIKQISDVRTAIEARGFCEDCGKKVKRPHLVPTNTLELMIEPIAENVSFQSILNAFSSVKGLCTCCARDYAISQRSINIDNFKIPNASDVGITDEHTPIEAIEKIEQNDCVSMIITINDKNSDLASIKRKLRQSEFPYVNIVYKTMSSIQCFDVKSNTFLVWSTVEKYNQLKDFIEGFCRSYNIKKYLTIFKQMKATLSEMGQIGHTYIEKIFPEQISFYISQEIETWCQTTHVRIPIEEKKLKSVKIIKGMMLGKIKKIESL